MHKIGAVSDYPYDRLPYGKYHFPIGSVERDQ